MFYYFIRTIVYLFILLMAQQHTGQAIVNNCTTFAPITRRSYIGWPLQIPCNIIKKSSDYTYDYYDNYEYDDRTQCEIWEENHVVLNKTSTLEDTLSRDAELVWNGGELMQNQSVHFTIKIKFLDRGTCVISNLTIQPIKFKQVSCHDYINQSNEPIDQTDLGESRRLRCSILTYIKTKSLLISTENVTLTWQRNCLNNLPQRSELTSNQLRLRSLGFDDAGTYSCSITYKGMTQYIRKDYICIGHGLQKTNHTIKCDKEFVEADVGTNAKLRCKVNFGTGGLKEISFALMWRKVFRNSSIIKFQDCKPSENAFCSFKIESEPCYLRVASASERIRKKNSVMVELNFRNISKEDFGSYVVAVGTKNSNFFDKFNVELRENNKSSLTNQQTLVIISIVLLLLVFAVLALLLDNDTFVKVLFKRLFGEFETDDKTYDASFTYHFSQSLDMFAQESLRKSLISCQTCLKKLGYSMFDEYKDGTGSSSRIETLKKSIDESHRLLIFVSHEFIKDDWGLLTLQNGFDSMIKSGSKLIFILLPGTKAYLKQHAADDVTCQTVLSAMKANYVIQYSNNKNLRRLKWDLEYAMPKLRVKSDQKIYSVESL